MKKRVLVIGNNTIACYCLEYLSKQDVAIVGVVPEPSDTSQDTWQLSLKKKTKELGLPLIEQKNLSDPEFLSELRRKDIDIIFSMQCRRILKKELIEIPKMGVINLHFAKLPRYRGCYPIAWAVQNGEKEIGVTLHYIDEGVDTGDLIAQRAFSAQDKTARELFDECTEQGHKLFMSELGLILEGTNNRIKQNDAESSYYPIHSFDFKNKKLDLSSDAQSVLRRANALIFPPFQFPVIEYEGKEVEICSVSLVAGQGKNGSLEKTKSGFIVTMNSGTLLMKEVEKNKNR